MPAKTAAVSYIPPIEKFGSAYCVNDGNMVDSNQQHTLASMPGNKDISVKGAMFDRGFCDTEDLSEFKSLGYDFLVMLKKNVNGYNKILGKYGKELHSNSAWYRLPKEPGRFGITDKMKLQLFFHKDCTADHTHPAGVRNGSWFIGDKFDHIISRLQLHTEIIGGNV